MPDRPHRVLKNTGTSGAEAIAMIPTMSIQIPDDKTRTTAGVVITGGIVEVRP